MKHMTRILCLLAICLLVASLMGEAVRCSPAEIDHDCAGDRCAVCFLAMSGDSFHGICILLLILFSAFLISQAHLLLLRRPCHLPPEKSTPVYLKVKLSN